METQQEMARWREAGVLNERELRELEEMERGGRLEEAFAQPLLFGTAGVRGVMAMGPGRFNRFTLGALAEAFGRWVLAQSETARERGVCVGFDGRHQSKELARHAAALLRAMGIPVYLFAEPRPTPELSFAVLYYGAAGGLNITASHNTKEYNGCKLYGAGGAQLTDEESRAVAGIYESLPLLEYGKAGAPAPEAWLSLQGDELDEAYLEAVKRLARGAAPEPAAAKKLRIVYTPLHGVGGALMPRLFKELGFETVFYAANQMQPDGDFPTVESPNPEFDGAFTEALRVARQTQADLILATDPDADRLGVMALDGGEYRRVNSNQLGCLMAEWMLKQYRAEEARPRPAIVKTVVSSPLANRVAAEYDAECLTTFTGFKHMAAAAQAWQKQGGAFLMAFEEACGFMLGTHCRDKDGIAAAMVVCLMAAQQHRRRKTLFHAIHHQHFQYGYFQEGAVNVVFPGNEAMEEMALAMKRLRLSPPGELASTRIHAIRDYLNGTRTTFLPEKTEKLSLFGADMLYYELCDGTGVAVRPSGTEPKIKCYIHAYGGSEKQAARRCERLENAAEKLLRR